MICFSYFFASLKVQQKLDGKYFDRFKVIDVTETKIILEGDFKCIVYASDTTLLPGDIIEAELQVYALSKPSYSGDFDESGYYNSKKITNRGKLLKYKKVDKSWNVARARWFCLDYFSKHLGRKSFSYLKTIIFGVNDLDKTVKKVYSSLYLSHILAISGLHINFLYMLLVHFFQKTFKIEGEKLAIVLLGTYIYFIGYPIPCLRAFLFLFFRLWNEKGELQYTKLDIFSITYISMVFFFPLQAFQMGFILSFLISFILIFIKDFYKGDSKIKKSIFTSTLCILTVLPFLINQTHNIYIIGFFFSLVLGYWVGKLLLPFAIVMLIVPLPYYEILFNGLDILLISISEYTLPFRLPHITLTWAILYYILYMYYLICLAKGVKKFTFLYMVFYFLIFISVNRTNIFYKVTFIDVGQGDSILIELPFNQGTILVDTYNNIEYLKCRGLTCFDYVILTHFDQDHIGSLVELSENFKIKQILYSSFEEEKKISAINTKKTAVHGGDMFHLGKIKFHILGPLKNYYHSNSNSLVIYFEMNSYSFLLTGDMTKEAEKDLVTQYQTNLKCDVLKVGHHGSDTSTSEEFLEYCKPSYSIISVSKYNSYGLPNLNVIKRLKKVSMVYETKDCGNIEVVVKKQIKINPFRKTIYT